MDQRFLGVTFVLFFLNLIGCTTATPIVGPDGTTNQLISCSDVEKCYDKAREVCGGPYQIVNTSSHTSGASGYTGTETKLLVKCGK